MTQESSSPSPAPAPSPSHMAFESRFGAEFASSFGALARAEQEKHSSQVRARVDVDRALVSAVLRGDRTAHTALRDGQTDQATARREVERVRVEALERSVAPAAHRGPDFLGAAWTQQARQLVAQALIEAYQVRGTVQDRGVRGSDGMEPMRTSRYEQHVLELADYFKRLGGCLKSQVSAGQISEKQRLEIGRAIAQATFKAPLERVTESFRSFAQPALEVLRADVSRSIDAKPSERSGLQLHPLEQDRGVER